MLFAQQEYPPRGFGRLDAHLGNTAQKERQPSFPVAGVADGLQAIVGTPGDGP